MSEEADMFVCRGSGCTKLEMSPSTGSGSACTLYRAGGREASGPKSRGVSRTVWPQSFGLLLIFGLRMLFLDSLFSSVFKKLKEDSEKPRTGTTSFPGNFSEDVGIELSNVSSASWGVSMTSRSRGNVCKGDPPGSPLF